MFFDHFKKFHIHQEKNDEINALNDINLIAYN